MLAETYLLSFKICVLTRLASFETRLIGLSGAQNSLVSTLKGLEGFISATSLAFGFPIK